MVESNQDGIVTSALNALASAPDGAMTVPDLLTHVETRHGSTDESAQDASAPEAKDFLARLRSLIVEPDAPNGLVGRGLVTVDPTGGMVRITAAGRAAVGR